MRIALIAPPFIAVPPKDYGGTELFVAQLAEGLKQNGIDVVVYANGDSTVNAERHWRYEHTHWPIKSETEAMIMEMDHTAWAVEHAARSCEWVWPASYTRIRKPLLDPWVADLRFLSHHIRPARPCVGVSTG